MMNDSAIQAVRSLARLKANSIVGQGGLTADDQDDVAAQLLLAVCSQLRNYDRDRASLRTFMCRVMDREIATILRYRLAWRRLPLGRPELIDGDAIADLAQDTVPSSADCAEFWLDVGKVVRTLPAHLRKTARAPRLRRARRSAPPGRLCTSTLPTSARPSWRPELVPTTSLPEVPSETRRKPPDQQHPSGWRNPTARHDRR